MVSATWQATDPATSWTISRLVLVWRNLSKPDLTVKWIWKALYNMEAGSLVCGLQGLSLLSPPLLFLVIALFIFRFWMENIRANIPKRKRFSQRRRSRPLLCQLFVNLLTSWSLGLDNWKLTSSRGGTIGVPGEKLNSEKGIDVEYVPFSPIDLPFHQVLSCRLHLRI